MTVGVTLRGFTEVFYSRVVQQYPLAVSTHWRSETYTGRIRRFEVQGMGEDEVDIRMP